VSELEQMYADAAVGRATVYMRATFLRDPHVGLRMFIPRDVFQILAGAGFVRAENVHRPPAANAPEVQEEA
jgi:hypothetical protein